VFFFIGPGTQKRKIGGIKLNPHNPNGFYFTNLGPGDDLTAYKAGISILMEESGVQYDPRIDALAKG